MGKKLDVVHSFVYLSSTLAEGCSFDKISLHIKKKVSGSFSGLEKHVWSLHGIELKTKVMVSKACVLMSLLYASEMWMLYNHLLRTL